LADLKNSLASLIGIISPNLKSNFFSKPFKKRAEIIANIEEKAELPLYHPFEFHLLTQEEFDK